MIIAKALISKMAVLRFVDVFEKEMNTMTENAVPKLKKVAAKSGMTLFEGKI